MYKPRSDIQKFLTWFVSVYVLFQYQKSNILLSINKNYEIFKEIAYKLFLLISTKRSVYDFWVRVLTVIFVEYYPIFYFYKNIFNSKVSYRFIKLSAILNGIPCLCHSHL